MNKLIKSIGVVSIVLTGGLAEGARPTYTLSVTESGKNQNAWTTPALWLDADDNEETAFSSEHDYFVANYKNKGSANVLRTPTAKEMHVFGGNSLILGSFPSATSTKGHALIRIACRGDKTGVEFPNDGLILPRGYVQAYYGSGDVSHLYGKVTVTSPEDYPSRFTSGAYNVNTILHVHAALAGDSNAYLEVIPAGVSGKTNFTCRISNAAQFLGTMDVQNAYQSDGVPWGKMWLELGNTTLGGSLIMGADTQLSGIADETAAGFTVASLTLKTGSALDLSRGGLTVTQSLTVESTPFTVKVAGLAQKDVTVARLQNLLTFPVSSGYTAKDFVLDGDLGGGELVIREEDGAVKIGLQYYPEAQLLVSDDSIRAKDMDSSMTNNVNWSNADAWPDAVTMPGGFHYSINKKRLRTSYEGKISSPEGDVVFPGVSLRIVNDGALYMLNPSFWCRNLILDNGSICPSAYADPVVFSGLMTIAAGGGKISQYNYPDCRIESEITGPGDLTISGVSGLSTSAGYATVSLLGLNTNYTGAITVTMPYYVPAPGSKDEYNKTTPRFDRNYVHFKVSDKRNLGGALSAVNPKALTLENMCRLELADGCSSLTLDEPTRGIFIGWVGRFLVEEGETMAISSPLAVHGTMWKEGDGRLVLGNPAVTFGADATDDLPDADATNRTLMVAGGKLEIASADAVNGLDVVFSNDVKSLVIGLDGRSGDFATYGMRNVKTENPFAKVEGMEAGVTLAFETKAAPTEEFSAPVFTVKKDKYDDVAALFTRRTKSATLKGWRVTTARRDNADGETATMVATVQLAGAILILR